MSEEQRQANESKIQRIQELRAEVKELWGSYERTKADLETSYMRAIKILEADIERIRKS